MAASPDLDPWLQGEPPSLPAIPALTTLTERRYCYWLTRERFAGEGQVVELGCWLGAATAYLAAGLRDRGSAAKVTCIDRFIWAGEVHDRAFPGHFAKGDDFEPQFRANTDFISPYLDVVRADLADFTWNGGPIEFLLVDAPKRRDIVLAFLASFGPHLIPGRSLVAFQDYIHAPSFALPMVLSEFDELQVAHVVLPGSTVVMELTRPLALDAERLARSDPSSWSEAETLGRWDRILHPLPKNTRDAMALSLPMLLVSQGRIEAARAEARRIADIPAVRRRLNKWQNTYLAVLYRPVFEGAGVEVKPTTAEMYHRVSSEALHAGRRDDARAAAEQALRLNPAYAPARRRLEMIDAQIAAEAARRLRAEAREQARRSLATKPAKEPKPSKKAKGETKTGAADAVRSTARPKSWWRRLLDIGND